MGLERSLTMKQDSQLMEYLTKRSSEDNGGVALVKIQYQDFAKVEYLNLTMRMGIDTVTTDELKKAGFHLYRAYNINLEDHHIIFEFMRLK